MRAVAPFLAAAFAASLAPPALAQSSMASAGGSLVIADPVGTGVTYDVLTDVLSGVFLWGQPGDSVSLLLSPRRRKGGHVDGEVVVLSTAYYGFQFAGNGSGSAPGRLMFLAQASASNGFQTGSAAQGGGDPDNMIFLAQFN